MTQIDLEQARGALGDDYELQSSLGQGGYATVFKAVRRANGQTVALKMQRLPVEDETESRSLREGRFAREVSLYATLDHPGIVRVLDSGRRGELLFMVLEFVPGETLAQVLARRTSLPVEEAVPLLAGVLEALEVAHSRGIVHRDLKPENLIVVADGGPSIKVLDFGVAALEMGSALDAATLTRSREVLGTPCYAAPEQLRGEPATTRSDIYSWGLVLLECLTGQRVMEGATVAQVFHKQLSPHEIPLPSALAAHPLGAVLRRALAKAPRDRGEAGQILGEVRKVGLGNLVGDLHDGGRVPTPTTTLAAANVASEQRQVTVVSFSVKVIPSRSGGPDFEVLDAVLRDQLRICEDTLRRHGGYVLGTLANRVVGVFGLPRASETDARRAGRAALELASQCERRAPSASHAPFELAVRVGVHTDLVIVDGDGTPSGAAVTFAVEVEGLAEPGTALVSAATRDLIHRHLPLSAVPDLSLTTFSGSHEVYRLVPQPTEEAVDAGGREPSPDLVGRDDELELLLRRWAEARAGKGSVALVRGEPGIGKTRLVRELRDRVRRGGGGIFSCQCAPEDSSTALSPVLKMLRERLVPTLGGDRDDPALSKLLGGIAPGEGEVEAVLKSWLGLRSESERPLALSGDRQRELLLEALTRFLCAGTDGGPHLVVMEDLQWADPTTREFVAKMAELAGAHPVLVLLTGRTEIEHPSARIETIDLSRLSNAAAERLVLQQGGTLTAEQVAGIVERTDGIPLFVEELTRSIARGASPDPARSGALPTTLRGLLDSHLDRLGGARDTAQLAAVIGREFDLELLATVSQQSPAALRADLVTLANAQILEQGARSTGGRFKFRHALIREAAWQSLLPARRRSVHRALAAGLEARYAEAGRAEPAHLAWHYEHAGEVEQASAYRLQAAQAAAQSSAYGEAVAHLRSAISLLATTPESEGRASRDLDLHNQLGGVLTATQGFATDAVVETFTRAATLLSAFEPSSEQRFATIKGLWSFHNARGDYPKALELGAEMVALGQATGNEDFALTARASACQTAMLMGQFSAAVQFAPGVEASPDAAAQDDRIARYGLDPWLTAQSTACVVRVLLGRIDEAERQLARGFAITERLGSPAHEAAYLGQAALTQLYIGGVGPQPNAALEACTGYAVRAMQLGERFGLRFAHGYASVLLAMAVAPSGDERAVAGLEQALGIWQFLGIRSATSWILSSLALGKAARGDFAGALAAVEQAVEFCQKAGEGYGASDAHRTLAAVLGDPKNPNRELERATLEFRKAIEIAQSQEARWLELRASYSYHLQAANAESRGALSSVVAGFRESKQGLGTALFLDAVKLLG